MNLKDTIGQIRPCGTLVRNNPIFWIIINQCSILRPRESRGIGIWRCEERQLRIGDTQSLITNDVPRDDFIGLTSLMQDHILIEIDVQIDRHHGVFNCHGLDFHFPCSG